MISVKKALVLTFAMGAVIFFCRVLPFLIFRDKNRETKEQEKASTASALLVFVEKAAPPAAMTVLAFNALAVSLKDAASAGSFIISLKWLPILAGAFFTAGVHLWKRNALISIFGGTFIYMALREIISAIIPVG